MAKLRIRVYSVEFGDAIFMTIPESENRRINVLVDFGNALQKGGNNDALRSVGQNLKEELNGEPLDLYIMTHEHMDHVQGPLLISKKFQIKATQVWMTASSATDYYERFTNAKKKKMALMEAYRSIAAFASKTAMPEPILALLAINDPNSSANCVNHIRKLSSREPLYIHRGVSIKRQSPFKDTKIRILAPEEDTSVYYRRLRPRTLGVLATGVVSRQAPAAAVTPPAGVAAGDFFDLVDFRANGMAANLLAIDKAANNSSVAIEFEWRGWRLLFPGDAEEKSWEIMDRTNELRPVHFLKVSHHGSKNGSPVHQIDKVFPANPHDNRRRASVVSTHTGAYPGVPDKKTLTMMSERSDEFVDTREIRPGEWHDFDFEG